MRRALVLVAAGLVLSACGTATEGTPTAAGQPVPKETTSSRAPFDGTVLGDGEVVSVDKLDGIRLDSPEDAVLRNHGVSVEVVEFGTADVVDAGASTRYGADEGAKLLAFRLRVTPLLDDLSGKVTATVSIDGRQRSLPRFDLMLDSPGEDSTRQYLVGVPDDRREVELELKYAGVAQQYDLLEGKRTGEQPAILYRSSDAPSVYVENLTPAKLPVSDDKGKPGNYVVAVTRAELTYFTSGLGDVPSDKDSAWLVLRYEPTGDGSLEYIGVGDCALPFASFELTEDGKTHSVVDKHSDMDKYSSKTLVFEVPATLTEATLTVKPSSFGCDLGARVEPFTATGEATVKITLPED